MRAIFLSDSQIEDIDYLGKKKPDHEKEVTGQSESSIW